ncbi:MAG: V-type ATP synthase subunit A [Thermodesulfobacteriota bacterium]
MEGKITGIAGPTVTLAMPGLKMYDRVLVGRARLFGEVIRLGPEGAVAQVYESTRGLGLGEPAVSLGRPLTASLGPGLLGAIYDGLQRPLPEVAAATGPFIVPGSQWPALDRKRAWHFVPAKKAGDKVAQGESYGHVEEDGVRHLLFADRAGEVAEIARGAVTLAEPLAKLTGGATLSALAEWPIRTPRPWRRKFSPTTPLVTGQRVIDFLFPLARGGTAILPGGFGTGKTVLEQAIAKFAEVDIVVYVGCGERGNEMAEMLEEFGSLADPWTGRTLMRRTIMVANTSNMPVAAREASIYTAVTMAEYYRDQGYHVLLLADSISRWAEALREISAALEEMPGEEGYPTYLASRLASFFARAGVVESMGGRIGSLSMILSVSPPGGDLTEPTTQACLRAAGAFLMLDTALAHRRHFPAIDWFQSFSLYDQEMTRHFGKEVDPAWPALKRQMQALLQREEKLREVAEIVGAEGLQDLDRLVMHTASRLRREFLCQNTFAADAFFTPQLTLERAALLLGRHTEAEERLARGDFLADILRETA